jgi:colicin import membrane protein
MWKAVRENPRAVTYAVLMHVGLLLLLVVSLDWTPDSVKPGTNKPIQAELVDMSKLRKIEAQKELEQQRLEAEKRKQEQQQQDKVEAERKQKAEQEKQRKAEAERKQKVEEDKQRKAEAERKQKVEEDKQRKAEAERKQKAEEDKQRKAEAERKQKAEQEKQRKAEAERKQKAEEEKKRKAEADARQREAEQALQAQLAEEESLARATSALSEYIPYIQEKVQNSWLRPAGSPRGLRCVIRVKLIPGGEVVDARVVKSSGDALFDRSVESAVLKASPLPLPADPALFKHFREIDFNFSPD